MSDKRMTAPTRKVLQVLLDDPAVERYGLELSKGAGIAHGTMYGILVRLEQRGWLTHRLEHGSDRATPPRRYYRLTDEGAEQARAALDGVRRRERVRERRQSALLRTTPGCAT
jgi:PadR family transcriptional regulator PadR